MRRLITHLRGLRHRQRAGDLSCSEVVELVTDYMEGALGRRDRARFEQHVATCDGCMAYVEQMRATVVVVAAIGPESLSPDAEQRLLRAFRGWTSSETA